MRGVVPIDIETGLQGRALGLAALFGLLTALPFILWPDRARRAGARG